MNDRLDILILIMNMFETGLIIYLILLFGWKENLILVGLLILIHSINKFTFLCFFNKTSP